MADEELRASFDERVRQWQQWTTSPWGRIRFAVVRHTLTEMLARLGPGPFRVLDVGGADGGDAIPLAEAGHSVVIVDPSKPMLALANATASARGLTSRVATVHASIEDLPATVGGGFDIVLCHFVLQYRSNTAADLRRLMGALGPQGLLSVIAPNPVGALLAQIVGNGPAAALAELDKVTSMSVTFNHEVRKITDTQMRTDLIAAGCRVVAQYGGRCANDLINNNDAKHDSAYYDDLERLELALCDRDPFNRIGMFWQLIAAADSNRTDEEL